MKQTLILLILNICFISLNAQNPDRKLKIGINFSPDYCYRTLKTSDNNFNWIIDSRNQNEIPKLSFSTSVNLLYQINNKIGVETGLQYSNLGFQTKEFKVNGINAVFKDSYHYINLPLKFNYNTNWNKKFQLTTSIGFINSYLLQFQKVIFNSENNEPFKRRSENQTAVFDFNKLNFLPILSLGINCKLNEKIDLKIEPTFRFGIFKIMEAPIKDYLWNAGLNMGFYYILKSY